MMQNHQVSLLCDFGLLCDCLHYVVRGGHGRGQHMVHADLNVWVRFKVSNSMGRELLLKFRG